MLCGQGFYILGERANNPTGLADMETSAKEESESEWESALDYITPRGNPELYMKTATESLTIAVREPDGSITLKTQSMNNTARKYFGLPKPAAAVATDKHQ